MFSLKKKSKNKKSLRTILTSENGISRKVEKDNEHSWLLIVLVKLNFKKYVNQYGEAILLLVKTTRWVDVKIVYHSSNSQSISAMKTI